MKGRARRRRVRLVRVGRSGVGCSAGDGEVEKKCCRISLLLAGDGAGVRDFNDDEVGSKCVLGCCSRRRRRCRLARCDQWWKW